MLPSLLIWLRVFFTFLTTNMKLHIPLEYLSNRDGFVPCFRMLEVKINYKKFILLKLLVSFRMLVKCVTG